MTNFPLAPVRLCEYIDMVNSSKTFAFLLWLNDGRSFISHRAVHDVPVH